MGDGSIVENDAGVPVDDAVLDLVVPANEDHLLANPTSDPTNNNDGCSSHDEDMDDNEDGNESSSVRVAVRIRPFLPSEAGTSGVVDVLGGTNDSNTSSNNNNNNNNKRRRRRRQPLHTSLQIGGPAGPQFTYDAVHSSKTTQADLYGDTVSPLVRQCLKGYNATVLAYGQTGSGKTYTILGPGGGVGAGVGCGSGSDDAKAIHGEESAGVIPRALRELFHTLEGRRLNPSRFVGGASRSSNGDSADTPAKTTFQYEIRLQFLELYGEEVRDLLSTTPTTTGGLKIRDNGGSTGSEPEVVGASEVTVKNADEALLCLARGMLRRVTGATAMNAESSRSHAIMSVVVEQTATTILDKDDDEDDGETSYTRSKFHFVDLAGSERARRTMATGQRLAEGININKGLLVLGNVISALGDPKKVGKTHVPYRDSKLTRLLRGSLGGNHRTLMVACVSPSSSNMEESLNCLRYANRARNIQNRAVVNVDPTTRLLGELRTRVKDLAVELLRVRAKLSDNADEDSGIGEPFSDEALRALASGGEAPASSLSTPSTVANATATTNVSSQSSSVDAIALQQRLSVSDAEMARVTNALKRAKQEAYQNEEGLYAAKAEAEYWKMKSRDTTEGEVRSGSAGIEASKVVERMASYEKEIAKLKSDLRDATGRTELAMKQITGQLLVESSVQISQPAAANPSQFTSVLTLSAAQQKRQEKRHLAELDEEDKAERHEFEKITDRYLSDDEDNDHGDENEAVDGIENTGSDLSASASGLPQDADVPYVEDIDDAATAASVESFLRRQSHMDAHLLELTTSIAAKEDLMEQLAASQRRYESMREFYERKLEEMVAQVEAREKERERLVVQLDELKNHEKDDEEKSEQFTKLTKSLEEKDVQIKKLRRRQKELSGLTEVPSRNEAVLARLKSDVSSMKRQKVDLQKQISSERKSHLSEVAKLRKDATQRSREAAKWRAMSERQKAEAERARNAAKSHVQEISKLRSRYRESEKRLRMQTLKRGVMQKVGLDPVLVGRRGRSTRPVTAPPSTTMVGNQHQRQKRMASTSTGTVDDVDIDRVRSFLDCKVADIGKKEATADKLAKEYEDHLELSGRRDQLLQDAGDADANPSAITEELEALGIQIQYREGRIRQLSKRLGDGPSTKRDKAGSAAVGNTFLGDKEFKDLCAGAPPLSASQLTCKILFGMVVRERRRVVSLARTAASLDERAAEAEKLAEAREEALVSHVEEERHERAIMAQNQQEQIMSLMALVQDEEERKSKTGSPDSSIFAIDETGAATNEEHADDGVVESIKPARSTDSMVMILSNERIAVLERQVAELEGEKEAKEVHRKNETEARQELKDKARELNESQAELQHLKSSLRQIRDILSKEGKKSTKLAKENAPIADQSSVADSGEDAIVVTENSEAASETTYRLVDEVIQEALHPPALSPRKGASDRNKLSSDDRLNVTSPPYYSPGMKSHVTLVQNSDSEDEEVPEWASDIMADLAIIAQGEMPPSLKKEKKKKKRNKRRGTSKKLPPSNANKQNNGKVTKATTPRGQEETNVFDRLTAPENWTGAQKQSFMTSDRQYRQGESSIVTDPPPTTTKPAKPQEEKKMLPTKPVFDRLTDPEYFTGVQKQSFMSASSLRHHHAQSDHNGTTVSDDIADADDVADRAISEILDDANEHPSVSPGPRNHKTSTSAATTIHSEVRGQEGEGDALTSPRMSPSNNSQTSDSLNQVDGLSSPSANDPASRSVFDRLISPSNYTGTQKKVHSSTTTKKRYGDKLSQESPAAGDSSTPLQIDSTPIQSPPTAQSLISGSEDQDIGESESNKTDGGSEEQSASAAQGQSRERIAEYTQQDVFERLTKTVTASYAVKHQAEE